MTESEAALVRAIRRAHWNTKSADDRQICPMPDGAVDFRVRDIYAFAIALAAEGVTVADEKAKAA